MASRKAKILIVDDEDSIREILTMDLEDKGYDVVSAANGREAILVLESENDVDLVLSDVRMPMGDGFFLLNYLQTTRGGDPPLVFFTGYSEQNLEQCLNAGAKAVLPKPFSRRTLFDTIEKFRKRIET